MARPYTGAYPRQLHRSLHRIHTQELTQWPTSRGMHRRLPRVHHWAYSATYIGESTQGVSYEPIGEFTRQPTQESTKVHTQEPTLIFIQYLCPEAVGRNLHRNTSRSLHRHQKGWHASASAAWSVTWFSFRVRWGSGFNSRSSRTLDAHVPHMVKFVC